MWDVNSWCHSATAERAELGLVLGSLKRKDYWQRVQQLCSHAWNLLLLWCCNNPVGMQQSTVFNRPLWAKWAVSSELFWVSLNINRFTDFYILVLKFFYCLSLSYRCLSVGSESVEDREGNWFYLIVLVHYQWHLEPRFEKQFWLSLYVRLLWLP